MDILRKNKIAVILGTPSAAPPPWLSQKYPEIFEVNERGEKLHPGGRRFTCPTNQTYRRLSLAIATEMARAFASNPGVIGWQVDNEYTLGPSGRCYCEYCQAGFQKWVREKYHNLDDVNRTWGTVFWSQTYTDWSQIPVDELDELATGQRTENPVGDLPLLEQDEGRDALHLELVGDLLVLVDVELDDPHLAVMHGAE